MVDAAGDAVLSLEDAVGLCAVARGGVGVADICFGDVGGLEGFPDGEGEGVAGIVEFDEEFGGRGGGTLDVGVGVGEVGVVGDVEGGGVGVPGGEEGVDDAEEVGG